ncbi:MAG: class I SAM-dependent methyltransferase [Lachnospiraceae bacterium]|nr:class I SAM-dependent methyltransferase [Lachnospiraceae bacterium]
MYKIVDGYYEPQDIMDRIFRNEGVEVKTEMSSFELAFVCGLLKEKRPKKIVEVGVSAGGTSAVILNCLSKLNIKTEMYSVDLVDYYYREPQKEMGYLIDVAKKYLDNSEINHYKYSGGIGSHIEEIGENKDIEFLILDTKHALPGEVLEFLVCLPYLSEGCIVVLHDVNVHHIEMCNSYVTNVLFASVSANKYYTYDDKAMYGMPNIAAFQVTKDTKRYVEDIILGLSIPWQYKIDDRMMEQYWNVIKNNYSKSTVDLFARVYNTQQHAFLVKDILSRHNCTLYEFKTTWNNSENVVIYGDGYWGTAYREFAKREKLQVDAIVISDGEEICQKDRDGIPIYHLSELPLEKDNTTFIFAIEEKNISLLKNNAEKAGYEKFL